MKPAWDQLMAAYDGSDKVVVADVDCTIAKDLSSKERVRGYPTIKYWKDGAETKYSGAPASS